MTPIFAAFSSARWRRLVRDVLGVRPQRLRDAGAEPIGLHQHRHQRAHIVDLGARREILERFDARLAGAHSVLIIRSSCASSGCEISSSSLVFRMA